jgi:hypothetical protein
MATTLLLGQADVIDSLDVINRGAATTIVI